MAVVVAVDHVAKFLGRHIIYRGPSEPQALPAPFEPANAVSPAFHKLLITSFASANAADIRAEQVRLKLKREFKSFPVAVLQGPITPAAKDPPWNRSVA
jgi:hypothetical protein